MTLPAISGRSLARLLLGAGEVSTLGAHLGCAVLPDLRRVASGQLIEMVDSAALRGRVGASLPVGRKLRAVASRWGRKVVLANGAEGEPASRKDRAARSRISALRYRGRSRSCGSTALGTFYEDRLSIPLAGTGTVPAS